MSTDWQAVVLKTIDVLVKEDEGDDEELDELLQRHGFPEDEAVVLSMFVPMAFGRVAVQHMGEVAFSPDFYAQGGGNRWVRCKLADQPAYVEAEKIASMAWHQETMDRETFVNRIAVHSSQLRAVSKALEAEGKVAGQMSPSFCLAPASLFVVPRPWWKFW